MGFFGKIFSKVLKPVVKFFGLDSLGQSVGQGVGNSVGNSIGNSIGDTIGKKIEGVPTPMTGQEAGQWQAAFQDAAYPGTTPWERLGQSPATSAAIESQSQQKIASRQQRNEQILQMRQLENIKDVTKMQNQKDLAVAKLQANTQRRIASQNLTGGLLENKIQTIEKALKLGFGTVGQNIKNTGDLHRFKRNEKRLNEFKMKQNNINRMKKGALSPKPQSYLEMKDQGYNFGNFEGGNYKPMQGISRGNVDKVKGKRVIVENYQ